MLLSSPLETISIGCIVLNAFVIEVTKLSSALYLSFTVHLLSLYFIDIVSFAPLFIVISDIFEFIFFNSGNEYPLFFIKVIAINIIIKITIIDDNVIYFLVILFIFILPFYSFY